MCGIPFKEIIYVFSWVMVCLVLAACSDSDTQGSIAESGAGETSLALSHGAISEFGSIWVNGIEYEITKKTKILLDGLAGSESDLRKGMQVLVNGQVQLKGTAGTAVEVYFEDEVYGPIAAIDPDGGFIKVLDRTVVADAGTIIKDFHPSRFDDADDRITPRLSLLDFALGDLVEISGVETENGHILASRIERKSASFEPDITEVRVKGTVDLLDKVSMIFKLGDLVVDYVFAVPPDSLADGAQVKVRGTLDASGDKVTATWIDLEVDDFAEIKEEKLFLNGLVTDFSTVSQFEVSGRPVDASNAVFENGTSGDLAEQVGVIVEGFVNAKGLQASKVTFRGTRIRILAPLEEEPVSDTFHLLGLEVSFNLLTEIVNGLSGVGRDTLVEAALLEGRLVATRIHRFDTVQVSDPVVTVRGPVFVTPKFPPTFFYLLEKTVLPLSTASFENVQGQ
ncbi:MAG: hypothetical protein KJ645_07290, partial [Planctomycetes bacterium]|nr:hypothetical protein [Planctomycetota bacterium]